MSKQGWRRAGVVTNALSVAVLLTVGFGSAQLAEAVILINEILANPGGADANEDGAPHIFQDEFVELVNPASGPLSLAGWTLSDGVGIRHVFAPDAIILGGGFLAVFGGGDPSGVPQALKASTGTLGLNNTGDTVTLRDTTPVIIDTYTYTAAQVVAGASLTRFPDAFGPFTSHPAVSAQPFSPGSTTGGSPQLPIPTPEPATLWLLGAGLLGTVGRRPRPFAHVLSGA